MKKENLGNLGKRINALRKDKKITAEQLSERCNINASYLRQIECGNKTPSLPIFISLCNELGVSADYLLQEALIKHEKLQIEELSALWNETPPSCRAMVIVMLKAAVGDNES